MTTTHDNKPERSMPFSDGVSGARRNRHPLGLDVSDPEGIARFLLYLDVYDHANIARALVHHCQLDTPTALALIERLATTTDPGDHE